MSTNFGTFVWYELLTSDSSAAEQFYKTVIGWDVKDTGMTDRSYAIFSKGPHMVGGLMTIPESARKIGARPQWMAYIAVDDVDAYVKRVADKGGILYRASEDIPNVGRFAVVADPEQAPFVLFKGAPSSKPPAIVPANTPGHFGWHEKHAGNLDRSFDFYSDLFGWTKGEAINIGTMGIYQLFSINGVVAGGFINKIQTVPVPFWLYYINVESVEATLDRVKKSGGKVIAGPHQVPSGGWIAHCLDRQGAALAISGPKN